MDQAVRLARDAIASSIKRDFITKLSAALRRLSPNSIHVFEDLDKGGSCYQEEI